MTKTYDSSSIQTLRFPENIRQSPSMYIGGTDAHGLFVILRELADNAVDEYLAGRNKFAAIKIDTDGSYWVQDGGSGIPQGTKTVEVNVNGKIVKSSMPTMQAVFGELHTSGKFRSDAYAVSIGCFAGETPVELVDGRTLTMRQIYNEHKKGVQNYVWTVCRKTGDLRAQPIERAMLTGRTRHLVEVTLDTGDKFVCTPNHPLYQTSLKKIEAESSVGSSLLSMNFEFDKDGYRVMPVVGDWPVRLHRVVADYNGMDVAGNHVHHIDENITNNEPSNLEALTPLQHYWEHPGKLEKWMDYLASSSQQKSKLLNRRNSKNWYVRLQQQGKALKIACRVVYLGKKINEGTYTANSFHGAPGWAKAIRRFESSAELSEIATELVRNAERLKSTRSYAARFLSSLDYIPGLSENSIVGNHSDLMCAKRIVGKAVAQLKTIPPVDATAFELDACFNAGRIGARGLCQYVDLDEFVSAVRYGVDPCDFLYRDLSQPARLLRRNKFDKDDASRRVVGWGVSSVIRQSNQFLRNLNAMLADKQPISQASYHERYKNAAGNSSWYLGVKACARRGLRGRDSILGAAKTTNHKVIKVKHIYLDDEVPVYDLTVGIDHNYRLACGVFVGNSHGVGVKGTNATSEFFDVLTCYKGKWFKIGFKKGKLSTPLAQAKAPLSPFSGKPLSKGTLVHFKPDASIFSVKSFPPQMLVEWAEVQAYLNPGLQVAVSVKGKQKSWISKEGPKEYITKRLTALKAEAEPDMFEFKGDLAHAVVAFSNADGFELRGYTNGLTNSQGGKHVDSVANALFQAVKLHAGSKQEFSAADFRDGMVGIVNAKLHKAAFSSQDKAKLTDDRMGKDFLDMVFAEAKKFFSGNKAMAKRLCDRAAKINDLKTKFKASKAVATELNKVKKLGLPPNYAPAHRSVPVAQRELFIVEGDSAAGGFRKVREKHQALLPLKGKIMNAVRAKGDKALISKDVLNILAAIGFDPKAEDPLKKLQVGKIVQLSDADPDGPLHGDTRVKLLDGTSPTIKEITDRWNLDHTQFWVWGVDKDGQPIPALARAPRIAVHANHGKRITFDDGTSVVCTPNHKWVVNYAKHTDGSSHAYAHIVKSKHLSIGDSVVSVDFDTVGKAHRPYTRVSVNGKMMLAHQRIKQVLEPAAYGKYRRANIGVTGGAIHIHHDNDNSLDNSPENLHFLTKADHGLEHMAKYAATYNGSTTQKVRLKKWLKTENGLASIERARENFRKFNQSQHHRLMTSLMNTEDAQIIKQGTGKCVRYFIDLVAAGKTIDDWDLFRPMSVPTASNLPMSWAKMLAVSRTKKYREVEPRALVPVSVKEYPTQKISKFLATCALVLSEKGQLTSETYSDFRARGITSKMLARGTPKWDTIFPLLGVSVAKLPSLVIRHSTNHKIVQIEDIALDNEPMYCLTVPATGNFLIEDANGNGIASGNSHINCLLNALLARYLPGMYDQGMVYVADMPEFYALVKDQIFTGDTLSEVQAKMKKAGAKGDVKHAKGWGEVNEQVLKVLAVDPTRRLIKINPLSDEDRSVFFSLMGRDEATTEGAE